MVGKFNEVEFEQIELGMPIKLALSDSIYSYNNNERELSGSNTLTNVISCRPNDEVNGISGVEDATLPVSFFTIPIETCKSSKAVEINAVAEVLMQ